MDFSGKVALVTGCKQGIGYEIAMSLAENGADLVLNDVGISEGDEIFKEISKLGKKAVCISADISNEDQVNQLFETVKTEFGKLDILVNNAGITRDSMSSKMTMDQWNKVIAVNLTGTFLCSRAAVKLMEAAGEGAIVNFSSLAGVKGNVGQANYSASKAAVIGLTKTLSLEYARKNVRVNAIAPGVIATPMTETIPDNVKQNMISRIPLQRMGTPRDVANVVLFLASSQAAYVTGQLIHVNGGMY
jgi:3-oxoacyl-[acyl-carrier protein] reductase